MACRILVPETASYPKIAQIAAAAPRGDDQGLAPGRGRGGAGPERRDLLRQPQLAAVLRRGHQTLAYELWEQLGFTAPDNVVCRSATAATCSAPTAASPAAAQRRDRRPSAAFGVQAARARPTMRPSGPGPRRCCRRPSPPRSPRASPPPAPPRGRRAAAVRETGARSSRGGGGDRRGPARSGPPAGLYVEPTSAVAAAGLTRLLKSGVIGRHESTCWC